MTGPEPSPNCQEGKYLFETWKSQPLTRFLGASDASKIGPAWRDFIRHMATCSLCDRRANERAA